jgi:hypothetical protein
MAVVTALGMHPHPEGGWYAETWRAVALAGERPRASAIVYLLADGERSQLAPVRRGRDLAVLRR